MTQTLGFWRAKWACLMADTANNIRRWLWVKSLEYLSGPTAKQGFNNFDPHPLVVSKPLLKSTHPNFLHPNLKDQSEEWGQKQHTFNHLKEIWQEATKYLCHEDLNPQPLVSETMGHSCMPLASCSRWISSEKMRSIAGRIDPWNPWPLIRPGSKWFKHNSKMLPSGKLSHNYEKSPFSMGKSTISMAIFNSYFDITRG